MSDDTSPTESPAPPNEAALAARARAKTRPDVITHDSDVAVRPGFRNPSTARSAARQKQKKNKKR